MEETITTQSRLARACWSITTLACLITAFVVFFKGDSGYGIMCFIVALSAGVNLL